MFAGAALEQYLAPTERQFAAEMAADVANRPPGTVVERTHPQTGAKFAMRSPPRRSQIDPCVSVPTVALNPYYARGQTVEGTFQACDDGTGQYGPA